MPCCCVCAQSWSARSTATLTLTQSSPRSTCSHHSPASHHRYAGLILHGLLLFKVAIQQLGSPCKAVVQRPTLRPKLTSRKPTKRRKLCCSAASLAYNPSSTTWGVPAGVTAATALARVLSCACHCFDRLGSKAKQPLPYVWLCGPAVQVLLRSPAVAPAPISDDEVAALCFPSGTEQAD